MYCPVFFVSPDLSLDMNEEPRSKGAFVCPAKPYSTMTVNGCEQYRKQMLVHVDVSRS